MEKNENITQGQDTHVGYGRNRGDGSDSQNQQPVDSLQRYADQSDAFFGKVTDATLSVSDIKEQLGISTESMFGGISKEVYKKVLSDNSNTMFEKAPPQFKDALNALVEKMNVQCLVGDSDDGSCYYSPKLNTVYMSRDFFMNNGSPYQDFWEVLLHEYSHAIDNALGGLLTSVPSHASFFVPLDSTGGSTLLETAKRELGGDDAYYEFCDFVDENDEERELNRRYNQLLDQEDPASSAMGMVADEIESRFGLDWGRVRDALYDMGFPNVVDVESSLDSVDEDLRKGIESYFKDDSFKELRNKVNGLASDSKKYKDELDRILNRLNNSDFNARVSLYKRFGYLNDIMSAVNGGRNHDELGLGHSEEYYGDWENRATEIFADIGPILAKDGKAAEWLKKKAPKLVAGYYELLGLALNKFKGS